MARTCLFCLGANKDRLTREHLVSRPVADAFRIDRTAEISTVENGEILHTRSLENLSVRLPCGRCNNGWMNDLEGDMRAVAKWVDGKSLGISPDTLRSLKRWLVKTHLVLTAIEGGSRRFGLSDDFDVIPQVTHGRFLFEDSDALMEGVAVGFARRTVAPRNQFMYLVETPRVFHAAGKVLNRRCASVTTLGLGLLQTWVVLPIPLAPTQIRLPECASDLRPGTTFRRLRRQTAQFGADEIVVDYGRVDVLEAVGAGRTRSTDETSEQA